MWSIIILLFSLFAAVWSISYSIKLSGRMKNVRTYVNHLLSLYAQLDISKQSDFLALLNNKQRKLFNKFNSIFLKNRKVKVSKLKNEPLVFAIELLYLWFLAELMNTYFCCFESLQANVRDSFAEKLNAIEAGELKSCLEMHHCRALNHETVLVVIQKDVIDKFVSFMLKHRAVLGRQMESSLGFAVPIDPIELFVHMYRTSQPGLELMKKKQVADDAYDNTDTLFMSGD
jgi:hypothetical protein